MCVRMQPLVQACVLIIQPVWIQTWLCISPKQLLIKVHAVVMEIAMIYAGWVLTCVHWTLIRRSGAGESIQSKFREVGQSWSYPEMPWLFSLPSAHVLLVAASPVFSGSAFSPALFWQPAQTAVVPCDASRTDCWNRGRKLVKNVAMQTAESRDMVVYY